MAPISTATHLPALTVRVALRKPSTWPTFEAAESYLASRRLLSRFDPEVRLTEMLVQPEEVGRIRK